MLKDLKKGDRIVNTRFFVAEAKELLTKKGTTYMAMKVTDSSGSVDCKLWDYNTKGINTFRTGDILEVTTGSMDEYNGNLQMVINKYSVVTHLDNVANYGKKTKFDVEEMWETLVNIVGSMEEPLTRFISEEILLKHAEFIDAFKKAPAAKGIHNAWYGGLLEHVVSLTTLAKGVVDHYRTQYCKKISLDKVLFGCILHDAGKLVEYDYSTPAFELTGAGLLANHLVLGPAWVWEAANKYTDKVCLPDFKTERAELMHLLAAHHGCLEWGSPVKPVTVEAIMVHHLDNLDSKVTHALELSMGNEGPIPGFSEKSWIERTYYKLNG